MSCQQLSLTEIYYIDIEREMEVSINQIAKVMEVSINQIAKVMGCSLSTIFREAASLEYFLEEYMTS